MDTPKNILYYSNYCNHCKKLLQELSPTTYRSSLHYICIDKRRKNGDNIEIMLENGSILPLPKEITSVPALFMVNNGGRVLLGENIYNYIFPKENKDILKQKMNMDEGPMPFSLGGASFIVSDNYSFLSQTSEEMMSKASGAKQLHHYATVDYEPIIETPPEDYTPDKVGSVSLETIRAQRDNDVPKPIKRM